MKLAVFDFDGTLLTKDTLPALGSEWIRQGRSFLKYALVWISVIPVLVSYKMKIISREAMKEKAFNCFNRIYENMSRQEVMTFFRLAYPFLKKNFNRKVLAEIRQAQLQGYHCVLVSGSYIELLNIVADDLSIDTALGAQLTFIDEVYDSKQETNFVDGLSKRDMLRQAFSNREVEWESSRAYGDSYTDIYIMETVGEKIAVRPDAELMTYAMKKGWRIIS